MASSPLGTQLLVPAPITAVAEPDEPSRDSMEAATGMFNAQALLGPLYEERESQEPTGRLGPEAVAAMGMPASHYTVSESSRPTAEIAMPASRAAQAPAERPMRTIPVPRGAPGDQAAHGGTLPMQPGYLPPIRETRQAPPEAIDWKKRTAPLDPPAQPESPDWKKRTAQLDPFAAPASPVAPAWRRSQDTFDPPSSSALAGATVQWQPLSGAGAATSTSPVSRQQGGPPSPGPETPGDAPRTSSPLMLVLIACSLVFVLSSLAIVVVTIRHDRPAAGSGAASASASASASAAPSANAPARR
jgi:hypothetical protein